MCVLLRRPGYAEPRRVLYGMFDQSTRRGGKPVTQHRENVGLNCEASHHQA